MHGKILKISSNDLYGNVDERQAVVFAVFNHVKYMNKYVIFTFKDEYNKNKLYYGSIHLKDKSLVIFAVNNSVKEYIDKFVTDYLNNNLDSKEYEVIDISNIDKVELVSYSEEDCDKLNELDKLSIVRVAEPEEIQTNNKKPVFLYILLVIMIALLVGVTYIYLNPEQFTIELKQLECNIKDYNQRLEMDYTSERIVKFDTSDKVREISVIDTYAFKELDAYTEFKDNNRQAEYFSIDGAYKYDDSRLELKLIYNDKSIIETYDEMKNYLKNEGYTCIEGKYYE